MNAKKLLIALAVGAVVGWTIFGVMVARVTEVERIGDAQSRRRFEQLRSSFEDPSPRLTVGEGGELSWQPRPEGEVGEIETLRVMAYRGPAEGLIQVEAPLWFLRLKEPAIRFLLRRTGVDPSELGLTSKRLRSYGPAIIVDERRANGNHLLIWTEAASEDDRTLDRPGSPGR